MRHASDLNGPESTLDPAGAHSVGIARYVDRVANRCGGYTSDIAVVGGKPVREFSTPTAFAVPPDATIADAVFHNAEAIPHQTVIYRRVQEAYHPVTARAFANEVVAVAKGLIAAGIHPGDRVGLMSRTRYEWSLLDYALFTAGAVVVPIYETSSAEQIRWILGDSGAVACVTETAEHAALVRQCQPELPQLTLVWQIEGEEPAAITQLIASGAHIDSSTIQERRTARKADDLATIIYTSGTTGRSKGCRMTNRNFVSGIKNGMSLLTDLLHNDAKLLLFLPLAHVLARELQCGAVYTHTQLAFSPNTTQLLDDLALFSPTVLLAVPRVFEKVYNGARQKAHTTGKAKIFDAADRAAVAYSKAIDAGHVPARLRIKHRLFDLLVYRKLRAAIGGECQAAISGGAVLGTRLAHFFRGVGITIYEGYGLTETTAACTVNTPGAIKIGTVGKPLPGVSIRIGDDSEVMVKGELVFDGYWNNAHATTETIDADGWFHTGDLGTLDEEGFLSITGRKKEIIVTAGGKNVAPAVLEDRLRAHALIAECMVVGDDRPFIGCLIAIDSEMFASWKGQHGKPSGATVAQLREDGELRAEITRAIEVANAAVSRAESIKVFRIVPHEFTIETGELTPSLKVKRQVVHEKYADEIAAIYA